MSSTERFSHSSEERHAPCPVSRLSDEEADFILNSKIDLHSLRDKEGKKLSGEISFLFSNAKVLARLVLELKERGLSYDTIISDDASGRLPSLLLRKIINYANERLGKAPVKTIFITGVRKVPDSYRTLVINEKAKFIAKEALSFGRALLVTEYIGTGRSIRVLIDLLEKEDVIFDIAAVSICHPPAKYPKEIRDRLLYGVVGDCGTDFYTRSDFSGVRNQGPQSFIHPVTDKGYPSKKRMVRNGINVIAEELSKLI
jgi:hypothetical protein